MRPLHTAQNYSDSMAADTSALHQKIRAILERANHPNTPQAEAETALALAFRLMQKHNISESDFISNNAGTRQHSITSKQFVLAGPYRVRRGALLHVISLAVNCASYRDMMDSAPNTVTMVAFGSPHDLYSLEILFTTAELLALRTMPQGDRRFRTSWWQGFTVGVDKKLKQENSSLIREAPGAGLVLVEQAKRADAEMRLSTPHLRSSSTSYSSDHDAFSAGRSAGSQFSGSKNRLHTLPRALGRGKSST